MMLAVSKFREHVEQLKREKREAEEKLGHQLKLVEDQRKLVRGLDSEIKENLAAIQVLEQAKHANEDWREPRDEDGYRKPE